MNPGQASGMMPLPVDFRVGLWVPVWAGALILLVGGIIKSPLRLVVPKHLQSLIDKREIRRSLGTAKLRETAHLEQWQYQGHQSYDDIEERGQFWDNPLGMGVVRDITFN